MFEKQSNESHTDFVERCAKEVSAACKDAPQSAETDDRLVAEVIGIRIALFAIASCLAPFVDAYYDHNGIPVAARRVGQ